MRKPGACESGFGCGNVASGVYVWAWGEGDHRVERIVCEECVGRGRTAHPAILDATPPYAESSVSRLVSAARRTVQAPITNVVATLPALRDALSQIDAEDSDRA